MIKDILAKYENFYKGGSGYTFQIEVDDFNALLKYIEANERLLEWNDELQEELIEKDEKIEALEKEIIGYSKSIKDLEYEVEELQSVWHEQKFKIAELEKEIVEHCETKGLAGRQVFALTKRVDELVARAEAQQKEIGEYEKALEIYVEKDIDIRHTDEQLNLLKDETKNLDDGEILSFNVSFVKDIIEEIEQKEKKAISKILAYVEKNHDAPEIEEYLWKLLDKGTEFE